MAAPGVASGASEFEVLVARLRVFAAGRDLLVGLVRVQKLLLLERGAVDLDGHGETLTVLGPGLPLPLRVEGRQILAVLQGRLLLLVLLVVMGLKHRLVLPVALLLGGAAHHRALLLLLASHVIF